MARGSGRDHSRSGRDEFDDAGEFAESAERYYDDRHDRGREHARDRHRGRSHGQRYDDDDDAAYLDERSADDGGWDDADRYEDDDAYASRHGSALVPLGDQELARGNGDVSSGLPVPALPEDSGPFIIPGSGESMGMGFLPRRERPLAMRLAVVTLTACVVFTGLFAVAPLNGGGVDAHSGSPFQALSGAVVYHTGEGFFWYTVRQSDTLDSVVSKFGVQVGGIYELNGMLSGEELQVGKAYKIPVDSNYGMYYRPASYIITGFGTTTYGNSPWTSLAGNPPDGANCGTLPTGTGDNMGNYNLASFNLYAPNPGAYWVRGFTWYHNGVDLANPAGTPLHASQAGEVIFSGWDPGGGGWTIKINHCNHLSTFYAHMEKLLVPVHTNVVAGQVIGLEGSTGWSTGPHCHFTVEWDNNPVDPMMFFDYNIYQITHRVAPSS